MKLFVVSLILLALTTFVYIDAAPRWNSERKAQQRQLEHIRPMNEQEQLARPTIDMRPGINLAMKELQPMIEDMKNVADSKFAIPPGAGAGGYLKMVPAADSVEAGAGAGAGGGGGGGGGVEVVAPPGGFGFQADAAKGGKLDNIPVAGDGVMLVESSAQQVAGVQELGAQVQKPASDGAKPDNFIVAHLPADTVDIGMPAGGEPGRAVAEMHAPPMLNIGGSDNQPLQQPAGGAGAGAGAGANQAPRLAKVPQHREQQIEQPKIVSEDDKHPIKKARFLDNHQPLKVKDLKPPNHLDAVRIESDGQLNKDYKKEIFLGNHEEIEQGTDKQVNQKLQDIFHKVDTDSDGFITMTELEAWIITKVEEHFDEAIKENEHVFKALDTDNDGDITWREFHIQFLMAKGHDQKKAEEHMEDYLSIPLESEDKEQLIRFKFRWSEADEDPQDNKLTLIEFRNFRHPEQSEVMLLRMVSDIMDNLDKDQNGTLTGEEFAALPPGEVDDQWKQSDLIWQSERKKEFRTVMDLNNDGIVNKDELKRYVDPKNPQHSKLESQNLIELADTNKDGKISLEEMLENTELFLGSKVVNTGRSFHDEF